MLLKTDHGTHLWRNFALTYLCLMFSLSLYGFIGDIILNTSHIMQNLSLDYILMYLLAHIFHIYIFGPAMVLYYFMFRWGGSLVAKAVFAIVLAVAICLTLYPDDYSFTTSEYRKPKQIIIYILAALTSVYFNEKLHQKGLVENPE